MSELTARRATRSNSSNAIAFTSIATVATYLERRLQRSTHADLRSVRVSEQNGAIRLEGRVSSYYAKQLAQVLARDGNAACRIDNAIDVA